MIGTYYIFAQVYGIIENNNIICKHILAENGTEQKILWFCILMFGQGLEYYVVYDHHKVNIYVCLIYIYYVKCSEREVKYIYVCM